MTIFSSLVILLIGVVGTRLIPGGGVEPAAAEFPAAFAMLLALVAALYVMMRLSFVFPAVAVDETYTLGHAWNHTRGQGLRLVSAMMLAVAPLMIGGWLLIGLVVGVVSGAAGPGTVTPLGGVLAYLLGSALGYLGLALSLTIISSAFRICTGWIPAAPPAVPASRPPRDADFDEGP